MDTVKITFNDGSVHEYPKGTSFYQISKDSDMKNIVGYKVGNEIGTLDKIAQRDEKIEFINTSDINGNKIYRAGLKFIFQVALGELFPELEVHYEHSVPKGVLGEVVGNRILSQDDIKLIKEKMNEIVQANEIISKVTVTTKEAIDFYRNIKEDEKADNIQNISDRYVSLYRLRGKVNYYYSKMPYNTGAIDKYDFVYLGNNRIIFLFPTTSSKGEVVEYIHYDKIISSFVQGKKVLNTLGVPYISDVNKKIASNKARDFVSACEINLNIDISRIIQDILNRRDVKFVLIAGPSSSGKTTTTKRIKTYFKAIGYDPIQISLDDYFLDRDKTPKDANGEYDFECVEALDIPRFNKDLNDLLEGKEVRLPVYNFMTGKSEESSETLKMQDNSIFLIEGLHAINDSLTASVDSRFKYKIYLSPFIPINIDKHNYVSTLDLRLIRRIVRDNRTRGYNVVDTINSWQSVRKGEEKYIFPFIHQADAIINTALAYELNVLKVYAAPLLLSVSVDSKYFEEARRLIDSLKQYWTIPSEYVPSDSILREFIGGLDD